MNAVVEGQSDMLACFLAALLLVRPNLAAQPDSLLAMHLQLLEQVCGDGFAALSVDNPSETMKFCLELDSCWTEFRLAAQAVQEASKTMSGIMERVHTFLGETLSHRARGQPKTMLDAKELREFHLYTSVNVDRLSQTLAKDRVHGLSLASSWHEGHRETETQRSRQRGSRDSSFGRVHGGHPWSGGSLRGLQLSRWHFKCEPSLQVLNDHHISLTYQISVTKMGGQAFKGFWCCMWS